MNGSTIFGELPTWVNMCIFFYRGFFWLLFLITFPFFLPRLLRRGGYYRRIQERFGSYSEHPLSPKRVHQKRFWIQAVSVGELQSIEGLIQALQDKNHSVVLTTTTTTGYSFAKKKFSHQIDFLGYFPFDFYPFVKKAFRFFQPDQILLVDSELWPEHLTQAKKHKIPVSLINARLSDRSYRRYRKIPFLASWLLSHLAQILTSSDIDKKRFQSLMLQSVPIKLTGNLKLDQTLPPLLTISKRSCARASCNLPEAENALVLIGISTWEGEEKFLINILKEVQLRQPCTHLLLVPRHPERRESIRKMLEEVSIPYQFKTEGLVAGKAVTVIDTMGELNQLVALADIAFIGKSFPPHVGGQSPLGATAHALPSVMGPEMSNFKFIVEGLVQAKGAFQVQNMSEARECILELCENKKMRLQMGQAARMWHESQQGALSKVLESILAETEPQSTFGISKDS